MEDNDKPTAKQFMSFGPGMRVFLLLGLYYSFVGIILLLAGMPQLAWLIAGSESGYANEYSWLSALIQSILIFAIPAIVYANTFPHERFAFFRLNKPVAVSVLILGALAMLVLIPGFDQAAQWISTLITDPNWKAFEETSQKQNEWFLQMSNMPDLLLCILVNALVSAVCEELFFRAGIQQILMERSRNSHIPIFSTALIFAFMHASPSALPLIFLAGLMLGYAFYWTGSLRLSIAMHFFFNATSIFITYLAQRDASFANWKPSILVVVVSFLASGGLLYLTWKFSQKAVKTLN